MPKATPGGLVKIPDWKAVRKYAFNRKDDFDLPITQSNPQYEWERALSFEETTPNALLHLNHGTPIVGNLVASKELLGLRAGDMSEFLDIPRGARKHETISGYYTIWESSKYFGRGQTLTKIPKVVLISASKAVLPTRVDGISTLISLADRIDEFYDLIEAKGLLVILDESPNINYNPYSYGTPLKKHSQPFATEAFKNFTGGDLLTIVFNPTDNELIWSGVGFSSVTGGFVPLTENPTETEVTAYGTTYASYFFYSNELTGFSDDEGDIFVQPAFYNQFTNYVEDRKSFEDTKTNYNARKYIIHSAHFSVSPIPWLVARDNTEPDFPVVSHFTYGGPPHGFGGNYLLETKSPEMVIGRQYVYNELGVGADNFDMALVIREDIEEFYGTL